MVGRHVWAKIKQHCRNQLGIFPEIGFFDLPHKLVHHSFGLFPTDGDSRTISVQVLVCKSKYHIFHISFPKIYATANLADRSLLCFYATSRLLFGIRVLKHSNFVMRPEVENLIAECTNEYFKLVFSISGIAGGKI